MGSSDEGKPAGIHKEYKIDFGGRRTRDTKYLPEFVALTKEIEDVYNELN